MGTYGKDVLSSLVILVISACVAACAGSKEPSPEGLAAIQLYFQDRTDLEPIEGIWARDDRLCEIAVFRPLANTKQDWTYVGVVTKECWVGDLTETGFSTRDRPDSWISGDMIFHIANLEPNGRYPAWRYYPNGEAAQGDMYIAQGKLYWWDYDKKWAFVRLYPADKNN